MEILIYLHSCTVILDPLCSELLHMVDGNIRFIIIHCVDGTLNHQEDWRIQLPLKCYKLARATSILVKAVVELDESEKAWEQVERKSYTSSTEYDCKLWNGMLEEGQSNWFLLLIVKSNTEFVQYEMCWIFCSSLYKKHVSIKMSCQNSMNLWVLLGILQVSNSPSDCSVAL